MMICRWTKFSRDCCPTCLKSRHVSAVVIVCIAVPIFDVKYVIMRSGVHLFILSAFEQVGHLAHMNLRYVSVH